MGKQFIQGDTNYWLFLLSMLVATTLACNVAEGVSLRREETKLYDEFRMCVSHGTSTTPTEKERIEECLAEYTPEEREEIQNSESCHQSGDCLAYFNDLVAAEEAIPPEPAAAQPESDPGAPIGSLVISTTSAMPQSCTRELTIQSLSMTCDFRLQAFATWETSVIPAYIHCGAGVQDGGTSSHKVSSPKGTMGIEVIANSLDEVNHVDKTPDDRYVLFSCVLSDTAEHHINLTPGTMATVRCLNPDYDDASVPGFCQAPLASWAAVWSAP